MEKSHTTFSLSNSPERYHRTIALLGLEKFARLQRASVTLVGVGAVGGFALEGLARAGVGHLRLVDFDTIEPSNINRQLVALTTTLGEKKVVEAKKRVLAINPDCQVEILDLFACKETLDQILTPKPDLLIDAIDSLNPKVELLWTAVQQRIPIISSMGAALRTDPSRIRCGDISQTSGCPLAKHVRKRLRKRQVERGITCIYSTEVVPSSDSEPEEALSETAAPPCRGRQRHTLGSLPTITGMFGLYIANQAILKLTQDPKPKPTS